MAVNKNIYILLFIILTTAPWLKAQPKDGEPGSKGSFKTQGFSTVLSGNDTVKHYELWYEGVKIMSGNYFRDKKEGLWRQTNLSGDVFFQGNYFQNKKNGMWKYFLNKKLLCTIYYKDDKKDSLCQSFYENGKTQCIKNYSKGLKNGQFKLFYDSGNLEVLASFKNDSIIGNCIVFYKDSVVRTNIEYKNGNPYNILIMNDSLGNVLGYGQFKNGNGSLKTYHYDGKIYLEENYKDGLKNGHSTTYFNNGEVNVKGEYIDGKTTGEWLYYTNSGKLLNSVIYKTDSTKTEDKFKKETAITKILQGQPLEFTERMPEFNGGDSGMMQFVKSKISYSKAILEKGISGTVYLTFTVTSEGSINDIGVLRGVTYDLNYEAIRVINLMPPWTPGFQNGFPVDVKYTLPIKFTIR